MLADFERASPEYYLNHYLHEDMAFVVFRNRANDSAEPSAALEEALGSSTIPRSLKLGSVKIPPRVATAYSLIKKVTGTLGGGAQFGPIFGELTEHAMQRVVEAFKQKCGLDRTSRLLDIGGGIGKPVIHVAQDPGVRVAIGVEVEETRCKVLK